MEDRVEADGGLQEVEEIMGHLSAEETQFAKQKEPRRCREHWNKPVY